MTHKSPMRYKHDCKLCKPLGTFAEYDLYYCEQAGIPTVIARFSDDESEYFSGLQTMHPILMMAEMMAVQLDYTK